MDHTGIFLFSLCCYTWGHRLERRIESRFNKNNIFQVRQENGNFRPSKTLTTICPKGTILRRNSSFLHGVDFFNIWYPWMPHVFPRCWESLKPLLCYEIKIDSFTSKENYARPCRSVCHKANSSCWMLRQFRDFLPQMFTFKRNDLLDCSTYSDHMCSPNASFTKSLPVCMNPLHATYADDKDIKILTRYTKKSIEDEKDVTGCSLLCRNDLDIYKPNHKNVYVPILVLCSVGLFVSLFTILTFLVDWKSQKRYPALILFILNSLFLLCLLGWLIQFFGIGNLMRCTSDNFRRFDEPQYRNSIWCLLSFVLIYFSTTAISVWFVILTYSWYISFKALGSTKNCIHGKVKYFHLIAWSLSLVLTIIVVLFGKVDSHEFTNICFLGYKSKTIRMLFVYFPYLACLIFGEIFIVCSTVVLINLHADCSLFLVPRAAKNIIRTIKRLIVYGIIMIIVVIMPIICTVFEYIYEDVWTMDYKHYIKCSIMNPISSDSLHIKKCTPPREKKLFYFYTELLCLFIACIATNSWIWTTATCRIWMQLWKKMTTTKVQQQLQLSWYKRMQKKKIAPFVPPIDPANPLEQNLKDIHGLKPFPCSSINIEKRHSSEDIRSVLELFSVRRCSKVSLESYDDVSLNIPGIRQNKSVPSLQSYGHVAYGNVSQVENNLFRKKSSNLTLMQLKNDVENGRCSSNLTLTHMRNMRDSVFTPISMTHKENIIADCIPYTSLPINKPLVDQSIDQSLCLDQGMEPYSISSVDEVVNR